MYWKTSLEPDECRETSHGASGESRVSHLKIPKGAVTHHPLAGGGTAFGSRALSEGDAASVDAFSQCRPACGHAGHRLRG